MYFIETLQLVKPGDRVLHFAPELPIGRKLVKIVGLQSYDAYDLFPDIYSKELGVQAFDLTKAHLLPSERYDFILHCHVLEHVPCYLAAVLWHLQRALTPRGKHLFFIPLFPGKSASDFQDITEAEKTSRFGQKDHVRRFGLHDLNMTIGQVLNLGPHSYGLKLPSDVAQRHNMSVGEVAQTMFLFGKDDLLLRNV